MAAIKSYTDIEQSKKLAEILPIESADMYYSHEFVNSAGDYYKPNLASEGYFDDGELLGSDIPCWSLAALLDILPRNIKFKDDKYYLRFMKDYIEYANDEISITGRCLHTTGNNNLVDACYEMILKLHELKML